jgi:hypothetical protein
VYGACVIFLFIVSIAGPIDRAMVYFKIGGVFFSIFTISTIVGIAFLVTNNGINPQMEIYSTDNKEWYNCYDEKGNEIRHFNILFVCTCIMFGVYFVPMIIRPKDFFFNFRRYIIGWITYMFMLPIFISVMSIYSMCNLHDISWGNRPAAADSA